MAQHTVDVLPTWIRTTLNRSTFFRAARLPPYMGYARQTVSSSLQQRQGAVDLRVKDWKFPSLPVMRSSRLPTFRIIRTSTETARKEITPRRMEAGAPHLTGPVLALATMLMEAAQSMVEIWITFPIGIPMLRCSLIILIRCLTAHIPTT